MIEPVALANFFTVFFSAAMVIICGALYALLFAFARLKAMPRLMPLAYFAYASLVVSVLFLADAANLFHSSFWTSIVGLMLVGYLVAPHAIWHLCVGTHAGEHKEEDGGNSVKSFQQS
jgi:hypothetical protein